ncbi:MAG: hypothetical protein HY547_06635 [Elusimicrobia bacterium]|nr:hypothetical protein [Elusimicrobiota bacterium]
MNSTISLAVFFIFLAFQLSAQDVPALGIKVTKTHIEATAGGKPPDNAKTPTQGKALARDAAIVSAQAHLVAYLEELKKGGQTLKELSQKDKKINLKIKGALSRAEVSNTHWRDDGSVIVTLRLSKKHAKIIRGVQVP